ncbi:hypothetical protein N8Z24_00395 [bacterium]|nr:hypothetical protein [bacterium]
MGNSLGDLEYQKFDDDGAVKIKEQSPRKIEDLLEMQLNQLNHINKHLEVQIKYLSEFFMGGILDDHLDHEEI